MQIHVQQFFNFIFSILVLLLLFQKLLFLINYIVFVIFILIINFFLFMHGLKRLRFQCIIESKVRIHWFSKWGFWLLLFQIFKIQAPSAWMLAARILQFHLFKFRWWISNRFFTTFFLFFGYEVVEAAKTACILSVSHF